MVCLILNGDSLPHQEELTGSAGQLDGMTSISINCNRERSNVILGKQTKNHLGTALYHRHIGNVKYQISPVSF